MDVGRAEGGCHCGVVRYAVTGEPAGGSLCHCTDCRRHSGAPMVAWTTFVQAQVRVIAGSPAVYASSTDGRRYFCGSCGTGLFFVDDAASPGEVDVQTATLDKPDAFPPPAHEQVAERICWIATVHELPAYSRFPQDGPPKTFADAGEQMT